MSFDDPESARTAVSTFMRTEVLAARFEATTRAEPEVGNLWRSEIALAEAVASTGLEGIRISEGDLLPRVALNGSQDADPSGSELALSLIRVLKAPGDPLRDPVATVRRFEMAVGTGMGPHAECQEGPEGHRVEDKEVEAIFRNLAPGDMPILTAARAAASYAARSEHANPVIERLVFMSVESALRGRTVRWTGPSDALRGLSGRVNANWVSPPALALSHRQFIPWSPSSEKGLLELGTGLARVFEAEVGRFALLRDWLRRGREAAQGRGGRSRLGDAVHAFGNAPVLSSALLSDMIGVTAKTALTIMGEMTSLGLLQEITHRRTARIWAVQGLGRRLAARPPRRAGGQARGKTLPTKMREGGYQFRAEQRGADQQAMERVFADLDAVLGKAQLQSLRRT